MPLKINRLEIIDGTIHYADNTSSPKVDIALKQTHIFTLNLKRVIEDKVELPSNFIALANATEGTLNFNMKLTALADNVTFDLKAEIKKQTLFYEMTF